MTTPVNANDPRVKRTRQLLLQAFMALLEEKQNIHSISVQDIAERATVNRATFYAHFEDKYALLENWMRAKFHRALESQLPASSALQMNTLRALILGVFDFLANFCRYLKPADKQFEPLFEVALQKELYEVPLELAEPGPIVGSRPSRGKGNHCTGHQLGDLRSGSAMEPWRTNPLGRRDGLSPIISIT